MPFLQIDGVFYPEIKGKKYDAVTAKILKMYVKSFKEAYYPMDIVYPNQRWKAIFFFVC